MYVFLLMIACTLLIFVFFALAIAFTIFFGKRKRKCACSTAREIMKEIEERERAARRAGNYDIKSLDPKNLPLVKK